MWGWGDTSGSVNDILALIRCIMIPVFQIMKLQFRELQWSFKVTWPHCLLCGLESWDN